jgi:hypothetical protein
MSRKLIVRLKGGLGNQMFCYASARRLAWFNEAELILDTVSGFEYDYRYQRKYSLGAFNISTRSATASERMEPFGRARRLIARKLSEQYPFERRRYIQQIGVDFDSRILTLRLQEGVTHFDAFGQSERYFADIRELLEQDFMMVAPNDLTNQGLASQIDKSLAVALHMRWFDMGDGINTSNISLNYYAHAITYLLTKIKRAHFYIFSDKPELAKSLLEPILQENSFTVIEHNVASGDAQADFWLMRKCHHFIIGNSTFAWWAAWLGENNRSDTQIIAPAYHLDPEQAVTAWGFPGLIPDRWITL